MTIILNKLTIYLTLVGLSIGIGTQFYLGKSRKTGNLRLKSTEAYFSFVRLAAACH